MALSGALAGVAGAIEVMGVQHRYLDGIAGSYGFDGIAVALLGGLGATGVIGSALFFGALASGSEYMETLTNVPAPISVIVQAAAIGMVGLRPRQKIPVRTEPDAEQEGRVVATQSEAEGRLAEPAQPVPTVAGERSQENDAAH